MPHNGHVCWICWQVRPCRSSHCVLASNAGAVCRTCQHMLDKLEAARASVGQKADHMGVEPK
jgi:hypothetical protein